MGVLDRERDVDELVDEILAAGSDEDVREGETPSAGGGQVPKAAAGAEPSRRVYELTCKDCGAKFGSAGPATRYCPACRKKRTSPPANDRQVKTGNKTEPEGAGDMDSSGKTDQNAWNKMWDELEEKEKEANKPAPEPDPADIEMDELLRTAADAMRRDTGDMILALYETIRGVAKASGIQTRLVIETMYEIDCTLSHIGGV